MQTQRIRAHSLPERLGKAEYPRVDDRREAHRGGVQPEHSYVSLDAAVGDDVLVAQWLGEGCQPVDGYRHGDEDANAAENDEDVVGQSAETSRQRGQATFTAAILVAV